MSILRPVILCGGSGTRLWPRSRAARPKPFLPLIGNRTLFEQTLDRCADPALFGPAIVVTGERHLAHVEAQAGAGRVGEIIVEPAARNTAAAIALAALRLPKDALMLVCPSDHHIEDIEAFQNAAHAAIALAQDDWLVSLAIAPTRPETGFGYIKSGEPIGGGYRVERFVEKPDLTRAKAFLADGSYSWNGGIFIFRAGAFLRELARHRPDIAGAVAKAVENGSEDQSQFHPDAGCFADVPSVSIDYAVMEVTDRAAMIAVEMGWSDIGNWEALRDARPGDASGNRAIGSAELVDCRGVMVETDGPRVSVVGLDNVVIVVDGDEILVTSIAGAQKVGALTGARSG